jgi:hypothetical protein
MLLKCIQDVYGAEVNIEEQGQTSGTRSSQPHDFHAWGFSRTANEKAEIVNDTRHN